MISLNRVRGRKMRPTNQSDSGDPFYRESVSRRYDIYKRIRELRNTARDVVYKSGLSRKKRKKLEVEVAYLLNEIAGYGVNFFPEIYVLPTIEELEKKVAKVS